MPTPERAPADPELARLLDALCTAVEGYGMEDWRDYPDVPPARAAVEAYLRAHYRRERPAVVVEPRDGNTWPVRDSDVIMRWGAAGMDTRGACLMASGSDDGKGATTPGGYVWRDPRMAEVARQLEDAAYAAVDIEEGSYSYYSRSVFTRASVKALSVNLEDVVLPREDHEEFMRLVHARFPFELGEARD